ncbi:helix-turn-helix transcriptional regulator [Paenibacillus sp. N3.4]|uniref:helix-turn-helix transcriptional regulator n=1 Tax=Paenibacillus sp. N3.4 TaxID=2603222 RepID=UPI0011CACA2B|nr:helix-turn-helix transcriptional regulator [Paenibacillus sp. N3.4]TXK75875.1 helix-turn-helix transcriptional regulator [Paenibacillus sp. N3.4]
MNFQDMTVGVVLHFPQEKAVNEIQERVLPFLKDLPPIMTSILKLDVVIGVGNYTDSIKEVPRLVDLARDSIRFRSLNSKSALSQASDIFVASAVAPDPFPSTLEKNIIALVRRGDDAAAIQLTLQFIQELSKKWDHFHLVQNGMMLLLAHIQEAVLQSGRNPFNEEENPFIQLYEIKEPHELFIWFSEHVITRFASMMQQPQKEQEQDYRRIVTEVMEMIDKNYTNNEISLESCAEASNILPYALSKSFKAVTGVNFIDYLTDVRMRKAQELLVSSDMKVNEIAIVVGYHPSYFNRIFKRLVGVPPGEYRSRHE